ncbi:alpha/beta hydrolase family protein [Pedobacter lusitanus]|uniref:hypothetical protein n=1 Tax=Pedobacter lusitanus TaxID=1503925 RepID=UPI0006961545|nr:hypothetical protein [Pedobacter lusitanus]
MKNKALLLIPFIAVTACSKVGALKEGGGAPSASVSSTARLFTGTGKDTKDYVTKYFGSNIEVSNLANPATNYYDSLVNSNNFSSAKTLLWDSWKAANSSRLSTFSGPAENSTADFVWDIPSGERMPVQLRKKGSKPVTGYPFLINLHGGGSYPGTTTPWGASGNTSEWNAAKSLGLAYADAPSYYFIPRMADDRKGRWYYKPQQTAWLRAWQLAVLAGDVNPDKTYILGISEGGYGSFRMGAFFADYFAGLGPMAGPETPEGAAIENLRNTATRVEVGEFDTGFGRNAMGADWKKRLDSATAANPGQFNHVVVIQPGKGHGINYYDVSPWLVKQTRKNYPDTLSFLYYDTDGAYRTGFGHVRLDGLSKAGKKEFKVIKTGNTFAITTGNRSGSVTGNITLYIDKVDFTKPVVITLNGTEKYNGVVQQNLGTMIESIALFGDPKRIFTARADIAIN